jgi:FMN phosphatase YigB (HAD superfamily)
MDGHWLAFARETGSMPDVHVAQSHFHDVVPATRLGVKTLWVNRLAEVADPPPTRELPTLDGLADVLDELVPA